MIKKIIFSPFQNIQETTQKGPAEIALPNSEAPIRTPARWRENKWLLAFKQIFPLFIAMHIAAFVITCFSALFLQHDFSPVAQHLSYLWQAWFRWDTGHYLFIAANGYTLDRTAFFPLYPLLIHIITPIINNNALITALLISSAANLAWMIVLYQLVLEDFGEEHAQRTILYLSIFPAAFFFLAAYTESLFLALVLLSFYSARHGRWWLSGIFGLLACLTRSTAIFLILPFCYEYLRQHQFQLRNIRFSAIAIILFPAGMGLFALYCWKTFGDPLSFSHQQMDWGRKLMPPWWGILSSVSIIKHSAGLLGFYALRNLADLLPTLLVLILIILACVGPWRFKKDHWAYLCYAIPLFILFNLTPNTSAGWMPLESFARFMLEVFPAFILLAILGGRARWLHFIYLASAISLAFFLLTQFLTGHWVI